MFAQERLQAIKKVIRERQRLNFTELHRFIKVSPATLRRDLTELEKLGEIIRVHGGVLDAHYLQSETTFDERLLKNHTAKKLIAQKAALLVPPSSTIFIDAGSTCLEVGKILIRRKDLRIITHSIALVSAGVQGAAEILCMGGELRKVSGALTGGTALGGFKDFYFDLAFVAASGLDPIEGCSTTELSEAEIKQMVLTRSKRKILLADITKWNKPSAFRFAKWSDFDEWIPDRSPSAKESQFIHKSQVKIHS